MNNPAILIVEDEAIIAADIASEWTISPAGQSGRR
jgi:hypothetical protein